MYGMELWPGRNATLFCLLPFLPSSWSFCFNFNFTSSSYGVLGALPPVPAQFHAPPAPGKEQSQDDGGTAAFLGYPPPF